MSWGYHVAADAWASMRYVDPEVQEAVLDELEELCAEKAGWMSGDVIHRIYPVIDGELHALTLDLIVNRDRRLITVIEVLES